MRQLYALLAGVSIIASMAGCSTVIDGVDQPLLVATSGAEMARCEIQDQSGRAMYVESTPGTITVDRGNGPLEVACSKDGYRIGTASVEGAFNWWTVGNVIGLLGFGVDFYTGAYEVYPERVDVPMVSLQAEAVTEGGRRPRQNGRLHPPPNGDGPGADMAGQDGLNQPQTAMAPSRSIGPDGGRLSMQLQPGGPVLSRHLPVFDEQTALTAEMPPPFPGGPMPAPQHTLTAADMDLDSGGVSMADGVISSGNMSKGGGLVAPTGPAGDPFAPASMSDGMASNGLKSNAMAAPAASMRPGPSSAYSVQIGAFRDGTNANRLVSRLQPKGYDVAVIRMVDKRGLPWHYVRFGSFPSRRAALSEARRFRRREGMSAIPVVN